MAVRYRIPFVTFDGTDAHVDIDIAGYNGSIQMLTGAANPIEWSEDDDSDLTKPIRAKTGYVRVIEYERLEDLRPATSATHRVFVYEGEDEDGNEKMIFSGFLQAQSFGQQYAPYPQVFEAPIVSALGILDGYKFPDIEPQHRTIGSLLKTAAQGVAGGIGSVVFPVGLTENYPFDIGLGDYISTQIVCPFNSKLTYTSPEEPIYDNKTYAEFIEALCHAFGLIVHDEPGTWVFTKPEHKGQYKSYQVASLDTLANASTLATTGSTQSSGSIFTMASNDGLEEIVAPVKEIVFDYEGETINEVSFDFKRTKNTVIASDPEAMAVLMKPLTSEFTSPLLQTSGSITSNGVMSPSGTYIAACGKRDSLTLSVMLYNVSGANKDLFALRFYDIPEGAMLSFKKKQGEKLHELEDVPGEFTVRITCGNYKLINDGDWSDTAGDTYVLVPSTGLWIPTPPQKGYPVDIVFRGSTPANMYTTFSDIKISKPSSAAAAYMAKLPQSDTVAGAAGAKESASIAQPFSYRRSNSRTPVKATDRYQYAVYKTPNYDYLKQAQSRLSLSVKGRMPADAYIRQWDWDGRLYRLISAGYNVADQIHTLVFQTAKID
jgi:hypothetical protein